MVNDEGSVQDVKVGLCEDIICKVTFIAHGEVDVFVEGEAINTRTSCYSNLAIGGEIMALEEYSKYFMYGGIILTIAVTAWFYFLEKQDESDISGVNFFLSRTRWQGAVIQTKIQSWRKLNVKYGSDCFYGVDFFLPNEPKLYTATTLIAPEKIHMLRKGLSIKVKKETKGKMGIIYIDFNNYN